jgi:hypothetical protein
MQQFIKSITAGILSGGLTCIASTYTLGFTHAFAIPRNFPLAFWEMIVVFGIGAMLVALVIHLFAIRLFANKTAFAFAAFAVTVTIVLAILGQLTHGSKVLTAWLLGALISSLVHSRQQSNNSFKRTTASKFE